MHSSVLKISTDTNSAQSILIESNSNRLVDVCSNSQNIPKPHSSPSPSPKTDPQSAHPTLHQAGTRHKVATEFGFEDHFPLTIVAAKPQRRQACGCHLWPLIDFLRKEPNKRPFFEKYKGRQVALTSHKGCKNYPKTIHELQVMYKFKLSKVLMDLCFHVFCVVSPANTKGLWRLVASETYSLIASNLESKCFSSNSLICRLTN